MLASELPSTQVVGERRHSGKETPMPQDKTVPNTADWQITDDTIVYGIDGTRLGSVRNYDPHVGYLDVQKGWFFHKDFYVPLAAIETVSGDGITLKLTEDELKDDRYDLSPPSTGVVPEEDFIAGEATLPGS
jgi:hypothetical protein